MYCYLYTDSCLRRSVRQSVLSVVADNLCLSCSLRQSADNVVALQCPYLAAVHPRVRARIAIRRPGHCVVHLIAVFGLELRHCMHGVTTGNVFSGNGAGHRFKNRLYNGISLGWCEELVRLWQLGSKLFYV